MENRKKFLIYFAALLAFLLIVTLPFACFAIWSFSIPPQFNETYLGGLSDKFNRLNSIDGKKLIVVGGSSVPFGLRSDLLENELPGYEVVNFGLYGTLGTKVMMDLSKSNISAGDLVIFTPEIDKQALSLYFNPDTMLECLDSNWNMYKYLDSKNQRQVNGHFFQYSMLKNKYYNDKNMNLAGVYQKKNLNEYGDIAYYLRDEHNNIIYDDYGNPVSLRKFNKMAGGYDPNAIIKFDYKIVKDDFSDYVADYTSFVKRKGATILFAFSPANAAAVIATNIEYASFYNCISEKFDMDIVGNPAEYVLDPRYFYDSNFHLNESGAIYRTGKLALDIKKFYKDNSPLSFDMPDPPENEEEDSEIGGGPNTSAFFEYSDYLDYLGKKIGLTISGVSSEHLDDSTMDLPWYSNSIPIKNIAKNAFAQTTSIETININKNIRLISDEAFFGCESLTKIVMHEETEPDNVMVGLYGSMLVGCNANVKIYVPKDKYSQYATNYYWKHYASYFVSYD